MKKSQIKTLPEYFDRYINLVEEIELNDALSRYGITYLLPEKEKFELLGEKVYAPGKWTVKDLLQHIIDTERIFTYRALRFARKDSTVLPGYNENIYADNAYANRRTYNDLLSEFSDVRQSTISLYKSFSEEMLMSEGVCFDKSMSVLAIGFTLAGHAIHHMNVVKERYYPLVKA